MLELLKKIFPYLLILFTIFIIVYVLLLPVIASWKLFKKVGIPGWKSLIPFYNTYLVYKIAGMPGICFIPTSVLTIVSSLVKDGDYTSPLAITALALAMIVFIINVFRAVKLPRAFNKGIVFIVGMIFLPEIFEIILGMGKSKYNGPYKVKKQE